jgi:hypothetical protein
VFPVDFCAKLLELKILDSGSKLCADGVLWWEDCEGCYASLDFAIRKMSPLKFLVVFGKIRQF